MGIYKYIKMDHGQEVNTEVRIWIRGILSYWL